MNIDELIKKQKEERARKAEEEKKARMEAAANRNISALEKQRKQEQERLDRLVVFLFSMFFRNSMGWLT